MPRLKRYRSDHLSTLILETSHRERFVEWWAPRLTDPFQGFDRVNGSAWVFTVWRLSFGSAER